MVYITSCFYEAIYTIGVLAYLLLKHIVVFLNDYDQDKRGYVFGSNKVSQRLIVENQKHE